MEMCTYVRCSKRYPFAFEQAIALYELLCKSHACLQQFVTCIKPEKTRLRKLAESTIHPLLLVQS